MPEQRSDDNALAKVGLNWAHRTSRLLVRRTRQLTVRLSAKTVSAAERAADEDGLTLAGWVEQTLLAELLARANRRIHYGNIQADLDAADRRLREGFDAAEHPVDGTPP